MENSHIEWTDHTWNPWIGCTKVDALCAHCYAEARDIRFADGAHWGKGAPRQRTSPANWREPYRWNRAQTDARAANWDNWQRAGSPAGEFKDLRSPRVFCASLADWLDDEVHIEWLAEMLKVVHDCQNLKWLLLTKRPQNWAPRIEGILKYIEALPDWDADPLHPLLPLRNWIADWFVLRKAPANIWIGTSVGTQESADIRIPQLLEIPAEVRFLSCEPLLGQVVLDCALPGTYTSDFSPKFGVAGIHWVICGGESGKGARPMHPDWARSLRDQCVAANVKFFFKQWGEHSAEIRPGIECVLANLEPHQSAGWGDGKTNHVVFSRVGKKVAGRELDGRTWDEMPA